HRLAGASEAVAAFWWSGPPSSVTGRFSRRPSASAHGTPSTGSVPRAKTRPNPACSASHGAPGMVRICGAEMASPYAPIARPRISGGESSAIAAEPHTVSTPNPSPRTADSSISHHSWPLSRNSTDGSPSASSPTVSVNDQPNRPNDHGQIDWVSTVASTRMPLIAPAPAASAPARTAHSGTVANSTPKPPKLTALITATARIPGRRHTDPLVTAPVYHLPDGELDSDRAGPFAPAALLHAGA